MLIKSRLKTICFVFLVLITPLLLLAGRPRVLNYTITPASPGFGDTVTLNINYCVGEYTTGHKMLVAVSSYDAPRTTSQAGQYFVVYGTPPGPASMEPWLGPDATSGDDFGYTLNDGPEWEDPKDCTDCGGTAGWTISESFTFQMPGADAFPGCDVDELHIFIKTWDSYLSKTQWVASDPLECEFIDYPISIGIPPAEFSIHKRVEGTVAENTPGDLLLFSIDYSYGNGQLFITDLLPDGVTFVKAGPAGSLTSAPSPGDSFGTLNWALPDRTGLKGISKGTVWFLVESESLPAGFTIDNTAEGTMGADTQQSSTSVTVGEVSMTIQKMQSANQLNEGETVTYYLEYEVNGSKLKYFESFDQYNVGDQFTEATGPPAGWRYAPYTSTNEYGVWTIHDPCLTGDNYINGFADASQEYPAMLIDDGVNDGNPLDDNDYFCTGMIVSDVMIEEAEYEGADAQVIIRHNNATGNDTMAVSLILSIDKAPGYLAFQEVNLGAATWPTVLETNIPGIVANIWFRVRILVEQSGNDYIYRAKAWRRGEPEPGGWQLTHTQPGGAIDSDWRCDGSGNNDEWYPGVSEQRGDTLVEDAYDNFTVYAPRFTSDAWVEDDIPPAGITFEDCDGCVGTNPVRWDLGSISNESGSLTWRGIVDCTQAPDPITNIAAMGGNDVDTVYSNEVLLEVMCDTTPTNTPTNTPTPTYTPTNTPTPTYTATPTSTYTFTSTPTYTATPTFTPTSTYTDTNTSTPTFTNTLTYTPTFTVTFTSTYTSTPTDTPTYTATNTITFTSTYTSTPTDTPTNTVTITQSPTSTFTITFTITDTISSNTPTDTPTYTQTFTPTVSYTATSTHTLTSTSTSTFTSTATVTITTSPSFTSTVTATSTSTATYTSTSTATSTSTSTPTFTLTSEYTATNTPTFTQTSTFTPTFTQTNTVTNTPTFTLTDTPTPTFTNTTSPTYTLTSTQTNTPTPTFTNTNTFTLTPTITPTAEPFPYILTIGVYNEAGELVRTVAHERSNAAMNEVIFSIGGESGGSVLPTNEALDIYLPGIQTPLTIGKEGTSFEFDAINDRGQIVDNGVYYIKLEQVDTYGRVEVFIKNITIINVNEYVEVNVFNSAGEIVRTIRDYSAPVNENLKLELEPTYVISKDTGGNITVFYDSADNYISWDGKNHTGGAVSSGVYEIQVVVKTVDYEMKEASKSILIIYESKEFLTGLKAYPNPFISAGNEKVVFAWDLPAYDTGKVRISVFNMAGELVKVIYASLEEKQAEWDGKTGAGNRVSHGFYMCLVEAVNAEGHVNRAGVKLAITGDRTGVLTNP